MVEEAVLDVDEGLVGDNWSSRGRSGGRPANRDAQVTVMGVRAGEFAAGTRDRWALAGDQLVVDLDLSGENLPPGNAARGRRGGDRGDGRAPHRLQEVRGTLRPRDASVVQSPEGRALNLRGINTRVVEGGNVRVGDPVRKL